MEASSGPAFGLVFGPFLTEHSQTYRQEVERDIVPIVILDVPLTQQLLEDATDTSLTTLRTVDSGREPLLASNRTRRRPEAGTGGRHRADNADEIGSAPVTNADPDNRGKVDATDTGSPPTSAPAHGDETMTGGSEIAAGQSPAAAPPSVQPHPEAAATEPARAGATATSTAPSGAIGVASSFVAPLLGWDAATREPVHWHPAGPGQSVLQNGHTEVWGSSGMGKTQFTMSLLGQLSRHSGSHFGIADFKNDYSDDTGFPQFAAAEFLDLWHGGAPYNPLRLEDDSERAIQSAVIELRDAAEEALRSVGTRIGPRQRDKLKTALTAAYDVLRTEGRWPTLQTLDDQLDTDLAGVLGDLTSYNLFGDGEPLGDVINRNVVFGLSHIPGNGATTVLAAGFIFSSLLLKIQSLPPVPNTIRYIMVVDEAHRVAPFRAIQMMLREGRSKGLAVILATQGPGDLPEVCSAQRADQGVLRTARRDGSNHGRPQTRPWQCEAARTDPDPRRRRGVRQLRRRGATANADDPGVARRCRSRPAPTAPADWVSAQIALRPPNDDYPALPNPTLRHREPRQRPRAAACSGSAHATPLPDSRSAAATTWRWVTTRAS